MTTNVKKRRSRRLSGPAAGLLSLAALLPCTGWTTQFGPTVTLDSLAPTELTAGQSAQATARVHSDACFTPSRFTVAVRDAAGNNLDFPGEATTPQICPSGYTFTSAAESFAPGTYQIFPSYRLGRHWHPLPATTLTVTTPPPPPTTTGPDHVVVAVMENHGLAEITGNPAAPYVNSLFSQGTSYTNDTGKSHPSLPNYLDLYSGSTQGQDGSDTCVSLAADNLGTRLDGAGLSVGGYLEGLPADPDYACRHNPLAQFTDAVSQNAQHDFTAWPTDFAALPKVSYVVPNLQNDWHDGTVQQGDSWLKDHLDGYVQWAKTHNSVLVLTTDENSSDTDLTAPVPLVVVGQRITPGLVQSGHVTHDSVLRTIEDWYGLAPLADSAAATALPGLPAFTGAAPTAPDAAPPAGSPVFSDTFTTPVAEGGFSGCDSGDRSSILTSHCTGLPAAVDGNWWAYPDGTPDTTHNGSYTPSKVLSIADGALHLRMRNENGSNLVAAPLPKIAGGNGPGGGRSYGRYEITWRAVDPTPGFKLAWLLWPDSGNWPTDGEIDFPEGSLNSEITAAVHHQNGSSGNDLDSYSTGAAVASGWHTTVVDWRADHCDFLLDGQLIGHSDTLVPNTPMHWVLQSETATDGTTPATGAQADVYVSSVRVWN
ncbi:alkaline phosphatase family protein [Kitasatospora azatica]|uniref:alkaline phosphatase family protein n=1 Tax=Kitasatospora azatica TaxID=58347 RepID=UPI00068A4472|nr:alkaline phosphatase family protein [Kitasatospora azatica]